MKHHKPKYEQCEFVSGYNFVYNEETGFREYTIENGIIWGVRGELLGRFETGFLKAKKHINLIENVLSERNTTCARRAHKISELEREIKHLKKGMKTYQKNFTKLGDIVDTLSEG